MDREETLKLDKAEIAAKLNELLAEGKTRISAPAELGLTGADLAKMAIFFNKGSFSA